MHLSLALTALFVSCAPSDALPDTGDGEPALSPRITAAIQGDPHARWVFEVDAVEGYSLNPDTVALLPGMLAGIVDKPEGIAFVPDDPLTGQLLWSDTALRDLGEATFDDDAGDDVYVAHLMLVDGTYTTANALGVAWGHTHIALFMDVIDRLCHEGPGDPDRVCPLTERGVLTHEIGHLLGLVHSGLPMVEDHEDPEHPGHDSNEACIMFWAYEGDGLIQHVRNQGSNEPELGFDEACTDDLAEVRVPE